MVVSNCMPHVASKKGRELFLFLERSGMTVQLKPGAALQSSIVMEQCCKPVRTERAMGLGLLECRPCRLFSLCCHSMISCGDREE